MDPAGKAHAFVDDIERPELDAGDRHHLERVLRLRPGDEITVADGQGRWRRCVLAPVLDPSSAVEIDGRLQPEISVAFALVKGGRPELVVQKLTEIGVDRIIPFVADRSVVKWDDDKAPRQHQRLTTVAREAAMQSRRSWLPEVEEITTFAVVASREGAVLIDRGGSAPNLQRPLALIGPEGGWSDQERAAGLDAMTLGATVLRAETAAIVAGAVLCGMRASLFDPVPEQ